MVRYTLIIILFVASGLTYAQQDKINLNAMDPFSKYGLGNIAENYNARSMAMGGISQSIASPYYINYSNPASYSSVDTLSFLFNFSLKNRISNYKLNSDTFNLNSYNFNGFGIQFPIIKKLGVSIGLKPYSLVSYDNRWSQTLTDSTTIDNIEDGKGGISKFYGGLAYKVNDYFQLGFNVSYLFGSISHIDYVTSDDVNFTTVYSESQTFVHDFKYAIGVIGHLPMNENRLNFGATFENETEVGASQLRQTILNNAELLDSTNSDITLVLPQSIAFGLSYEFKDKLVVGVDYSMTNWAEGTYISSSNQLLNGNKLKFGAEFTPKSKGQSYWQRTSYRLGAHIYDTPIEVNNEQVKDIGINFGLGLPLRKSKSTVNIAAEIGKRGSYDLNLVEEKYINFIISLSLFDHWFYKRKID